MKTLLSLDISSSTVGWAVFEYNNVNARLINHGHYKPPTKAKSKDCLPFRLQKTIEFLENLIDIFQPDEVSFEDYAKKFSKGKSTANVIILLATFNEVLRLTAYKKTGKDVLKYPVTTIRSVVGKHFNEPVVSKDDIFPVIVKYCPRFNVKRNKKGNIAEESMDEADAVACGITCIIKQSPGVLVWLI